MVLGQIELEVICYIFRRFNYIVKSFSGYFEVIELYL